MFDTNLQQKAIINKLTQTQKINGVIIQILCSYLSAYYGDNYTYEGFDNETIEILHFQKLTLMINIQ